MRFVCNNQLESMPRSATSSDELTAIRDAPIAAGADVNNSGEEGIVSILRHV